MQIRLGVKSAALLMVMALALTVSCQKKTVAVDKQPASTGQQAGYGNSAAEPASAAADNPDPSSTGSTAGSGVVLQADIFFEFDKAVLTREARETLTANAAWLRDNSDVQITIEGHCDERGTNDYNLALGDRRAESVRTFLADLGIDRSRLTTISYGEERPFDPAHDEAAWARNRRAHFLIR